MMYRDRHSGSGIRSLSKQGAEAALSVLMHGWRLDL